jgi:hypothetical protein
MYKFKTVPLDQGIKCVFSVEGNFLGFQIPFGQGASRLATPSSQAYTWATKPALGRTGETIIIDDPLISNTPVIAKWNATVSRWILEPHIVNLGTTDANIAVDNVVTELAIATFALQLGVLGANGKIEIYAHIDLNGTTTAASSTVRGYIQATGTVISTTALTAQAAYGSGFEISNRNAVNSQIGYPKYFQAGGIDSIVNTRNSDTTQLTIQLTHQWGAGGTGTGTARCRNKYCWVIPQA